MFRYQAANGKYLKLVNGFTNACAPLGRHQINRESTRCSLVKRRIPSTLPTWQHVTSPTGCSLLAWEKRWGWVLKALNSEATSSRNPNCHAEVWKSPASQGGKDHVLVCLKPLLSCSWRSSGTFFSCFFPGSVLPMHASAQAKCVRVCASALIFFHCCYGRRRTRKQNPTVFACIVEGASTLLSDQVSRFFYHGFPIKFRSRRKWHI
jgi:hypothetical protein